MKQADPVPPKGDPPPMAEEAAQPHPRVFLLAGRDKRIRAGHPWVYSNEIRIDADAKALAAGTIATLHRVDGKPLGIGTFDPHSLIAFRLFSREPGTVIGRDFLVQRLGGALALRTRLFETPYYRLVHGEADGLPGLVADRYGGNVVLQTRSAGMEALLPDILAALDETIAPEAVVLRNDGAWRLLEGLERYVRVAKGTVEGPVEVIEGELRFPADLIGGQKTGWFYDQRDSRAFMAGLGMGRRMLDLYCHSGGFAVRAAAAGAAEVLAVDTSEDALELARAAARINGVAERCTFRQGEAFGELERLAGDGQRFAVVAADPPSFVKSKKALKSGLKGYRKLARLAAAVVEPGGFLFLASCSHNVDRDTFAEEVTRGLAGAGRQGRVIRASGAGPDHPVHPRLAESAYLKSLVFHLD